MRTLNLSPEATRAVIKAASIQATYMMRRDYRTRRHYLDEAELSADLQCRMLGGWRYDPAAASVTTYAIQLARWVGCGVVRFLAHPKRGSEVQVSNESDYGTEEARELVLAVPVEDRGPAEVDDRDEVAFLTRRMPAVSRRILRLRSEGRTFCEIAAVVGGRHQGAQQRCEAAFAFVRRRHARRKAVAA